MENDNRKIKSLSDYDKEEIFFVRWGTFIIATFIVVVSGCVFFNLNGYLGGIIFVINILVPPLFFFRKEASALLKEKIKYWWSIINGRIPK